MSKANILPTVDEIDKHHLVFDRPAIYECSCGMVVHMIAGESRISEMPKNEVKYLPCGHAECCKTDMFDCIICAMTSPPLVESE